MGDESAFRKVAIKELEHISGKLDAFTELTVDLASEILTVEFDDGDKFVANLQGPTQQIWFAARYQAGHFSWDDVAKDWLDSKTKETLRARVARDVEFKLKKPVAL
jgi:iron donor protein CyaY